MKKIKMKARAGVTLVELLVVILIVTILSVSMLPLLQPFVVEAQYAAEPIPVIGNIRTKVGLYQYDKGKLPCLASDESGKIGAPRVETWGFTDQGGSAILSDPSDYFLMCSKVLSGDVPLNPTEVFDPSTDPNNPLKHFGTFCDIDWQELKGKRSKPNHYQYLVMQNGSDYAYFLGCFGDGNGLKMGTGYAVCEIVSTTTGHKYVGTWKRWKPVYDAQVCFSTDMTSVDSDLKHTKGCWVPEADIDGTLKTQAQLDELLLNLQKTGWEF